MAGQSPLGISWALSSLSGYGVYGTRLGLSHLKRGGGALALYQTPLARSLNPLEERLRAPGLERAAAFEAGTETLHPPHPVLQGVGNGMAVHPSSERIHGAPDIGCIAFEDTRFHPAEIERAQRFAKLIAISSWNEGLLRDLGFRNVVLARQGIAPELFHPRPGKGLMPGRFVIFSGGKLEYRKGQDLVLAAFRRFRARHPEALLLAAWQSPHAEDAKAFALAGHVAGIPEKNGRGGLDLTGWATANGVPEEAFAGVREASSSTQP